MFRLPVALAFPEAQDWFTVAENPSFVSLLFSFLTASLMSSSSVLLFSDFEIDSKDVLTDFSVRVLRLVVSTSSTDEPGLSQTWLTGVPRNASNSKKYCR